MLLSFSMNIKGQQSGCLRSATCCAGRLQRPCCPLVPESQPGFLFHISHLCRGIRIQAGTSPNLEHNQTFACVEANFRRRHIRTLTRTAVFSVDVLFRFSGIHVFGLNSRRSGFTGISLSCDERKPSPAEHLAAQS